MSFNVKAIFMKGGLQSLLLDPKRRLLEYYFNLN